MKCYRKDCYQKDRETNECDIFEVASCALSCCDGFQPMEDEVDPEEPEE
jgi:hypothetical protein